jgi:hypothetical protein
MFMVIPGWNVLATLAPSDNRAMASYVKLHVSDDDFESVIKTLKSNGYQKFEITRDAPESVFAQTVED